MTLGHGLNGSPTLAVDGDTGDELAEQLSRRLTDIIDLAVARGHGLSATTESLTVVSPDTFDPGLLTAAHRGADTPLYTLRYNRRHQRHRILVRSPLGAQSHPRRRGWLKPANSSPCATSPPV